MLIEPNKKFKSILIFLSLKDSNSYENYSTIHTNQPSNDNVYYQSGIKEIDEKGRPLPGLYNISQTACPSVTDQSEGIIGYVPDSCFANDAKTTENTLYQPIGGDEDDDCILYQSSKVLREHSVSVEIHDKWHSTLNSYLHVCYWLKDNAKNSNSVRKKCLHNVIAITTITNSIN